MEALRRPMPLNARLRATWLCFVLEKMKVSANEITRQMDTTRRNRLTVDNVRAVEMSHQRSRVYQPNRLNARNHEGDSLVERRNPLDMA